jgi:hypothetical protein
MIKSLYWPSCNLFLSDFNEIEFSRKNFEKILNIKFHEIRRVVTELFHVNGQRDSGKRIDRHEEAYIHFLQFCERA